ncbi:MAG: HEAT repeat domain-containing protein, partial [Pyrinomonadaceae bacterium]
MNVRQTSVCSQFQQTNVCWTFLAVCAFFFIASAQTNWPETEARLILQLSGDTEQKRSALSEIRNYQTEQASRLAVTRLKDSNEIVRATAASSVIFLPKAEAVNAIAPLLDDKAEFVRREAAYALGNVSSPGVAAPLLRLLQREKIIEVRSAAVIALGQSGDVSVIGVLVRILKTKPKDETEFLRRSAARSIGQIAQIA